MFGPQTGYFAPQLLTEQAVVAPGIRARGVSFAGTSLVVQLGRGVDYAWSATSAGSDLVDTVVERLCEPGGGDGDRRVRGLPVGERVPCRWTRTCTRRPRSRTPAARGSRSSTASSCCAPSTASSSCAPRSTARRSRSCIQRSTYGRELDSALGFERLGNPDYVKDAAGFREAAAAIDYTFNWFYVDDRDIAYYSSGRLPLRAEGVDPHLPRWGDAAYDWQGWLATDDHPQQVNPPSGYLVSLEQQAGARLRRGRRPVGLRAGAPQRGAVRPDGRPGRRGRRDDDGHGRRRPGRRHRRLPRRLHPAVAARRDRRRPRRWPRPPTLLRGWAERGAHRLDQDRDGAYEEQAAIALFDEWWGPADGSEQGVAQDLLRGTLGDLVGRAAAAAGTTTRGRGWAPPGTASPGTATSSRTSTACAAPTPAPGRRPTAAAVTSAACQDGPARLAAGRGRPGARRAGRRRRWRS